MSLNQVCDDCNISLNDGDNVYCDGCWNQLKVDIESLSEEVKNLQEELSEVNAGLEQAVRELTEMDMVREGLESDNEKLKSDLQNAIDGTYVDEREIASQSDNTG